MTSRSWFNVKWAMNYEDTVILNRIARTMERMTLVDRMYVEIRGEEDLPSCSCCSGMYTDNRFDWYSRLGEDKVEGTR